MEIGVDSRATEDCLHPHPRVSGFSSLFIAVQLATPLFRHAALNPSIGPCLSRERICQLNVSSTAVCGSIPLGRPQFLKGGLHLRFEVLQW